MQGSDIDKAINWLSMASNNNLMRLAEKAERFLVQAATHLSDSPEAEHIPQRSLLHMLDSRYAAIERMQQTAREWSDKCDDEQRCREGHRVQMSDRVKHALYRLRYLEPEYPDAHVAPLPE